MGGGENRMRARRFGLPRVSADGVLRCVLRVSVAFSVGALVSVSPSLLPATWAVSLGIAPRDAAAGVPSLAVQLDCPPRAGQGRIVCMLEISSRPGSVLRWADALVVSAPDFAPPLRSRRVASLPEEGTGSTTIAIPLFAREENTGTLRVKARAVVCAEGARESCSPVSREAQASVAVMRAAPEIGPTSP